MSEYIVRKGEILHQCLGTKANGDGGCEFATPWRDKMRQHMAMHAIKSNGFKAVVCPFEQCKGLVLSTNNSAKTHFLNKHGKLDSKTLRYCPSRTCACGQVIMWLDSYHGQGCTAEQRAEIFNVPPMVPPVTRPNSDLSSVFTAEEIKQMLDGTVCENDTVIFLTAAASSGSRPMGYKTRRTHASVPKTSARMMRFKRQPIRRKDSSDDNDEQLKQQPDEDNNYDAREMAMLFMNAEDDDQMTQPNNVINRPCPTKPMFEFSRHTTTTSAVSLPQLVCEPMTPNIDATSSSTAANSNILHFPAAVPPSFFAPVRSALSSSSSGQTMRHASLLRQYPQLQQPQQQQHTTSSSQEEMFEETTHLFSSPSLPSTSLCHLTRSFTDRLAVSGGSSGRTCDPITMLKSLRNPATRVVTISG